jgi:hypothetical protein
MSFMSEKSPITEDTLRAAQESNNLFCHDGKMILSPKDYNNKKVLSRYGINFYSDKSKKRTHLLSAGESNDDILIRQDFDAPSDGVPYALTAHRYEKMVRPLISYYNLLKVVVPAQGGEFAMNNLFTINLTKQSNPQLYDAGSLNGSSDINITYNTAKILKYQDGISIPLLQRLNNELQQINTISEYEETVAIAFQQVQDQLGWLGAPDMGVEGLLYNSSITSVVSFPSNAKGNTYWTDCTFEELYARVQMLIFQAKSQLGNYLTTQCPLCIVAPPESINALSAKINNYNNISVLNAIKLQWPNIDTVECQWAYGNLDQYANDPNKPETYVPNRVLLICNISDMQNNLAPVVLQPFTTRWMIPAAAVINAAGTYTQMVNMGVGGCLINYPLAIVAGDGC